MKIFKTDSWDEKVNFVDINNRLLGYSLSQSCCEDAGWFISERDDIDSYVPPASDIYDNDDLEKLNEKLESYVFDKDFFKQPSWSLDAGEAACFRLIAEGKQDLYLYLYNYHNGYYGHGFTFKEGNEILREEVL